MHVFGSIWSIKQVIAVIEKSNLDRRYVPMHMLLTIMRNANPRKVIGSIGYRSFEHTSISVGTFTTNGVIKMPWLWIMACMCCCASSRGFAWLYRRTDISHFTYFTTFSFSAVQRTSLRHSGLHSCSIFYQSGNSLIRYNTLVGPVAQW